MAFEKELKHAMESAKLAGKYLLSCYSNNYDEQSEFFTPTTEADKQTNNIIIDNLINKYSDYGFLSEESVNDLSRLDKELVWVIDPIDGTKDFIKKTGDFSVLISLLCDDKPVLGVVYKPLDDCMYYGLKDQGSFMINGSSKPQKLIVSSRSQLTNLKILLSRYHRSDLENEIISKLGLTHSLAMGSAGLKCGSIALGKSDIYLNASPKTGEWDLASGKVIVEEAGGIVTDIRGQELMFNKANPKNINGFVVSNGSRHCDIIETINAILLTI